MFLVEIAIVRDKRLFIVSSMFGKQRNWRKYNRTIQVHSQLEQVDDSSPPVTPLVEHGMKKVFLSLQQEHQMLLLHRGNVLVVKPLARRVDRDEFHLWGGF